MLVADFLRCRPCLEELKGYLDMVRHAAEHPDELGRHYTEINADVLVPLEEYRQAMLAGKIVPAATTLPQEWTYKLGSKPRRKPDAGQPPPAATEPVKYLVANHRKR